MTNMQQSFQLHVDEELILDCMRCGFCLPSCPTYVHLGNDEALSPRGRIATMKAIRDGFVTYDDSIKATFDTCLGCRACEPACPAGVQYGALIEQTREAVQHANAPGLAEKTVRQVVFNHLFAKQSTMTVAVNLVTAYQKTGLQKVVRKVGFMNLFPKQLQAMEKALPPARKKVAPLKMMRKSTLKVAFFTGCLMDTLYKEINDKTIALLTLLGVEVVIPDNQSCCGALHGHSGELEKGKNNLVRNVEAFDSDDFDYIVNNAGGCGAFLKEYELHLKSDARHAEKAKRFSARTIDISSLLVKAGMIDYLRTLTTKTAKVLVTYQDSCHLRNVNKVIDEPRALLKALPNVEYHELQNADTCCGSAGIYNILQPVISGHILQEKMKHVKNIEPAIVVTSNPGCLIQMQVGINNEQMNATTRASHIVEVLYDFVHAKR
ncbi:MAG: (Fe-S)-binding protein [Solibacillus sp.]